MVICWLLTAEPHSGSVPDDFTWRTQDKHTACLKYGKRAVYQWQKLPNL